MPAVLRLASAHRLWPVLAALGIAGGLAGPARAASGPLRGLAVDEDLNGPARLIDLAAGLPKSPLPLRARVRVDVSTHDAAARAATLARLADRLEAYQRRRIPVILDLPDLPVRDEDTEPWRSALREILERTQGRLAAVQIGEVGVPPPQADRYAFLLKLAAVQIRSVDAGVLVFAGAVPLGAAAWLDAVFERATGSYLSGIAIGASASSVAEGTASPVAARVERETTAGTVIAGPFEAGDRASRDSIVAAVLASLGTPIRIIALTGESSSIGEVLASLARIGDMVAGDLVPLDMRPPGVHFSSEGTDLTSRVPHRLLYDVAGLGTYLVFGPAPALPPIRSLDLDLTMANASNPTVRDAVAETAVPAHVERDAGNRLRLRLTMAAVTRPVVLDFSYGAANEYTLTAEAQQERLPRVEEIVFRYQQTQAAQDAVLRRYVADVRIAQHFHPSPADPAYNVVTENRMFSDRDGVEWQEISFWFNGARWTSNRPAFPLLQPEKVLSLPLDLRLNQDYTYRLDGVESVGGRAAFVVRFDPIESSRALYRGTVWIDRQTFVRLKVQSVETHLSGPVVSNDETQTFRAAGEIDGRPIWLLDRLDSEQVFLIAGRTVLVEREVGFSAYRLNPAEFDTERQGARASDSVMYRETDQGLRYLVKQGDRRVVSQQLTRSAKAFALGADVDPSLDYPLPIGGLDILDFNFLNRDVQFALLYGGVIGLGNIQKAGLAGGRVDVSGDFFGIAVKSNDSMFDAGGERRGERVARIPASVGANLGYQATPFQKVTARYELRYDAFFRDALTAPAFVVPVNGFTNGLGGGYEYRRKGYAFTANAGWYRRSSWVTWGDGSAFDPAAESYTRYDLGVAKDVIVRTFQTIHLNAAYFGGRRLDRFSEYQFGLFDATRMHGVPSAVRFGELAMFRGSYSFNLFDQYRFDLFLDQAVGRETKTTTWEPVTGVGLGLNLRAPRNTILRADIGKSFLPPAYRGAGSVVVQILLLKPL